MTSETERCERQPVQAAFQRNKEDVRKIDNKIVAIVVVGMGVDRHRTAVEEREERVDQNGANGVDGDIVDKGRKVLDVLDLGQQERSRAPLGVLKDQARGLHVGARRVVVVVVIVVLCAEYLLDGWKINSLLKSIATRQPCYQALIDTGAIITGFSNVEVAEKIT